MSEDLWLQVRALGIGLILAAVLSYVVNYALYRREMRRYGFAPRGFLSWWR